jgi:hypothetical protein
MVFFTIFLGVSLNSLKIKGYSGGKMEALACNICKEPAWNFRCMDCMAKDVKEFLPGGLAKKFQGFHKSFYSHFDSAHLVLNGAVYCVSCRSTKESPICPNCYTNEVYTWLEEKSPRLARKFIKMFSFGGPAELPAEDESPAEEEFGICDECGEYTEELVLADGEWVCRECATYQEE